MKKILFTLFLFLLTSSMVVAVDDVFAEENLNLNNEVQKEEKEEIFEQPILLEPEETAPKEEEQSQEEPKFKTMLKGIVEQEYALNDISGLFKSYLTHNYEKGPLKNTTLQMSNIMNWSEKFDKGDSDFTYDYNTINVGIKGQFRSEKESYNVLFDLTPDIHDNFWHRLVLDAFIQTKRIPHHTVQFGTFRPTVGIEGTQSPFLLPFVNRTQIARNFGNARKTGLKISGDYKYVDYSLEGYSSDVRYCEFFPGVEGVAWINFKPLANIEEKAGKLKIGGGIQAGDRNGVHYNVGQAAMQYDYKRFELKSEFAYGDGSNGSTGLSNKKRWGYNATIAYMITKKIQFLLRFDDFDNDRDVKHNNSREYTAGINYFILGQKLKVALNYVFCQNQAKADSHKIILLTQILL